MPERAAPGLIRPDWPAPAGVAAFTTTRSGGFSGGPYASLNLGENTGDARRHVQQNRARLTGLLPCAPRWLQQVHGARVIRWDQASEARPAVADAITGDQPGQVCAVLSADCLPVLFCNRAGTRVAAAHAGWRGLSAGVLEATVAAMACDPAELMAWLGPAIGPGAFEVGRDVYEAFVDRCADNSAAFEARRGRWLADLYALARLALARVGVDKVFGGRFCTYSDPGRFFSYRRDGATGRMASVIWISAGPKGPG